MTVGKEDITAGHELADLVCRELCRAGIPAYTMRPEVTRGPGARVEVDDSRDDHAGGLYVRWSAPSLAEAAVRAVTERQDPAAPEWRHHAKVALLMRTALIGILRLAGFSAVPAEEVDDIAEGDVYVHAGTPSRS
ncbi:MULTISPECIES: hypothetical protein [Streptomyces]|uniref:Uncharacterized protein n=1 Tax=Streptomyces murinus TaxID=33900 RepID=A0A7W3NT03_STRMR|nr:MULTISPECIES: hypothetical protein [Streptomyces]MBA9056092.1 hypothetical protein [Streptomyces murinus]UWW90604.1 hypothetical protein GO605_06815 [Streptomyces murinus]WSI87819.1 hypothetical protein OG516_26410 [Streptomyces murinus]WUD09455.1 hypothetical protein OG586_26115 [Streptomyces murinus]